MNIFLFDGTYELFRAHFGAPPSTSPAGTEVGATVGLASSLLSHLRSHTEAGIAIAFDQVIESFRNDLFPGYKTGEGIDPVLLQQFPLAIELSHALGLTTWPMVEFEADDALATAAAALSADPAVHAVWIATPDKDLAQCVVDPVVRTLDRRREVSLDRAGVIAKFGVAPESIPDYLALVGDSADGIPGIRGWGPTSSGTVLAHYLHLESIPDDARAWEVKVRGAATLAGRLAEERTQATLYRKLATLRRDVPIEVDAPSLLWQGADRTRLPALLGRLGAEGLLERVPRWNEP